jgi:preprotein translocase subunit SecA
MFSASLAEATTAMRPGPIAGRYPQRSDRDSGWFDRLLGSLKGSLTSLTVSRQTDLRKIVAEIGRHGQILSNVSNSQLENLVMNLQRRFRTQGLTTGLCIRAFALIRETSARIINKRHYDCQLMGGWVMLQGQLAEMETGEGKTLTATLAAATAALAGIPVHVLTVNEYLVQRDATSLKPLYSALGLTVGYVTGNMTPEQRRAGYRCDITYCTHHQVAFDYLRDRLLLGNHRSRLRLELESAYCSNSRTGQFLLRGLCFAIVDEADSVLIDEARTPLIITREIDSSARHAAYRKSLDLAKNMQRDRDFVVDRAQHHVMLTRDGQRKLADLQHLPEEGLNNTRLREELVRQALHALHLLQKDRDYLVREDKVFIIDANTGRTMPDRSWERGLHQMVEAKEGCPLTRSREQLGRLTYQRFFSRYMRLGAMSGTAREVHSELWSVYGLRVRRIPLHRPSRRLERPAVIYGRAREKWEAVVASVKNMQAVGRPVLVGTGSVAESELLSRQLTAAGIAHRVLNARQDEKEAQIVADAGKQRQVTVATNMAGRGTDIPLGEGIAERGGLHVIAACCNDAKRIDRQLFGRCARQGDPGSYQVILSLEDEWILKNGPPRSIGFLRRLTASGALFQHKLNSTIIRRTQRNTERRHRRARRALLKHDRQTGRLLAFSGHME